MINLAPFLCALTAATVAGLALIRVGLRGRRTDDYPLCRRCRFDLTGRPADSARCPECGADLSAARAIVVGHRQRRRVPLTVGLLLFALASVVLGLFAWRAARQANWWAAEPTWLLLRQAGSADPAWRSPALQELTARARQFDVERWDAVAAAATAYDADAGRPWDAAWGNLLAPATAGAKSSPQRWAAFIDELAQQATSSNAARRTAVLDELTRRLADSPVDDGTRRRIVARALDYQADPSATWDRHWGDILEAAHTDGHLMAGQWQRYAEQAVPPTAFAARIRPRVRRGDPLPYWLADADLRGPMSNSTLRYRISNLRLTWVGRARPPDDRSNSWSSGSVASSGGATGSSVQPDEFPPGLPDGIQHVHLTATLGVYPAAADGDIAEHAAPMVRRTVDLPATFVLQPADQPTVQVVHDPALADAVRKSLKVDSVQQQPGSYPYVNVTIAVNGPPVGLAFRIGLVQGSTEVSAGTLACPAGQRNASYGTGGRGRLSGPTADVVLHGDPAAAAGTVDGFTAWDGTVVFKGVPVARP